MSIEASSFVLGLSMGQGNGIRKLILLGYANPASALDLLPETIRNHPSVITGAIAKRVQLLDDLGWSRAEIRRRLIGVETADSPGAAALTRLDALAIQNPPSPQRPRPRWCGQCDQRTRMREDKFRDARPYRCPECHPRTAIAPTT